MFVLAAALISLKSAYISIKRFFTRRHFARAHGCQDAARSPTKEPFLGLDAIPATIDAIRQHRILEKGQERSRIYSNTYTAKGAAAKSHPDHRAGKHQDDLIPQLQGLRYRPPSLSFKPLLGKGIFDTDGAHWVSSRALVRPSFTRDQPQRARSYPRHHPPPRRRQKRAHPPFSCPKARSFATTSTLWIDEPTFTEQTQRSSGPSARRMGVSSRAGDTSRSTATRGFVSVSNML